MKDFYPFTSEDIPELFPVGKRYLITVKSILCEWADQTAVSFLLSLVIDLLDDVERIRAVKNYFQVEYGVSSDAKISEGFLHIVKAYLEENNGTRDMSPITELMKSDGHPVFANDLEEFFLQYSVPAPSRRSKFPSIYLRRNSVQAGKKSITGSSKYFWNNDSVEQSLKNSDILEELFKKLRAELLRRQVDQALKSDDWMRKYRKEKAMSLLLPLAIDLLDNVERIRALKKSFQKEFGENRYAEISDGFLKIVETYLEANKGTGNLLKMTEVLGSNGHLRIAECLKEFFVQYSRRACSEGSENANIKCWDFCAMLSKFFSSGDALQADKKDITGSSKAQVQALQNHVILEEIFKKLHVEDQKLFRLVSPTWMEETMPFWRINARVSIWVSHRGIALTRFMDLWERNKEITKEEETARAKAMQRLKDVPFHSFHVSYHSDVILYSSETEKRFWRLCCWRIEDLKIQLNVLNTTTLCKFMLKGFCQNLKQLEINCENWGTKPSRAPSSSDEEEETKEDGDNQAQLVPVKKVKIAKNLQTLIFDQIDAETLRSILFICPNLKELHLWKDKRGIGALLSPTSNGEFIKLKKLISLKFSYTIEDFRLLRQYTQILARNRFDSLEHLQFQTCLSNARSPPFNLYAALALASKNLKALQLGLILSQDLNSFENLDWFMDLSPFAFPNLTKLNLIIDSYDINLRFGLNFDFGTLKGMPMLEKLKINAKNLHREVVRNGGTQDWVFEGNRNRYLPIGVPVDYQYSAGNPILCSNLKEFTFHHDWSLNEEDVRLLSSWFPNLTFLEAGVQSEALPIFEENWQRLEKLVIHTEKLIPLRKLRPLKEAKKRIQIFQRFLNEFGAEVEVVLKEQNGRLFFSV